MTKQPIWQWSAVETATAVRKGKVSAVEVTRAHIARMKAANPAVNAVVVDLSAQAVKAAQAADRAVQKGSALGPLHGVPVTVKINVDVKGQANSNGVVALKDNIAPDDSAVVRNLRQAGAIIIGMTNTPEFSLRGFTDNPLHGLTLNPWDHAITCGGSSGGAGAATALGIGAIGHGNDIGGSLRWPAHCNGLATIRPTQGRIPAFNPSATSERPMLAQMMSAQGPLAREVRDVRLALEVMSGRDARDPFWAPAPLKGPKLKAPIKVGLARIPADMDVDPQVIALQRKAADYLSDAGYAVKEIEVPDLTGLWQLWCNVLITETQVMGEAAMRQLGSKNFIKSLEGIAALAKILDLPGFMAAMAERTTRLRSWMNVLEEYPVLLTPTTPRQTPLVNADLGGNAAVRDIFFNDMRFISALNVLGLPAAVVPVGVLNDRPVGVQIVASRFREDLALDAAAAIEKRVGVLARSLWGREG